jgi:hypothetical protein
MDETLSITFVSVV